MGRPTVEEDTIERYLRRIHYRGSTSPTIDVLRKLHRQHLLSVPFENLDIHLHRPIELDQKQFYNKIVQEHRGGYCYELNGCFAWLLRNLGFKVSMLSARVARKNGSFSPEFDHMTLLVRLRQRWVVDVGFGDSFTDPKHLDDPEPQKDDGQLYKIARNEATRMVLRWNRETGSWDPQYAFSLRSRKLADFTLMNRYQQTSPDSHFTQGPLISQLTKTGRVTLTNKRLIVTTGTKRIKRIVRNAHEFDRLLSELFKIHF